MKFFLLPWIALAGLITGHPLKSNFNATTYEYDESHQLQRRASPGDFYLRILPLGASIVWGYTSVDGNGFRKHLRDQLRYSGWDVNMVGTLNNGGMADNNVEATPGYVIDQINGLAEQAYKYLPNLVVINAGTNDCATNLDIANAHIRLGNMLDGLFNAIPDTTIIVSTLLPNANAALTSNALIYNANLRKLLATRIAAGQKIVTAEMETGFMTIDDIGSDGTHPTTEGYFKMASVFWYAIQAALVQDMITAPAANGYDDAAVDSHPVCLKTLGDTLTELETQVGSGTDDGIYVHKSTNMGIVYTILAEARDAKNDFWFANILGSGRDDIVQFRTTDDGTASFVIHQNLGGGSFSALTGFMDVGWFCNARGVRWGDFNADGLDDFICVGPEGDISLAINNGDTSPPTFTVVGLIMAAQEELQDRVRLGDIDGDGRCDYCVVHDNGDLHCWRNGGNGLAPTSAYEHGLWQDLGLVWTGGNGGDVDGVMLVDINGDHRWDWLSMDTTGSVVTSTNSRFCNVDPSNFLLDWQNAGNTHAGLAQAGVRDYIKFGRVFGNTGYRSYVHITNVSLVDDAYEYSFNVFLNEGAGGTRRKADGNHYCDMRGTGADDYIWVEVDGTLTIFGNEHSYPNWVHYGEVFTVPSVYDRRAVHFADMDGDGLCDILHVNTATGATEVFHNNYNPVSNTFSFTYLGFQSGSISCTQGMGVGLRDLGVRFADIDGNGLADYLCIEPDGRTTGWLNMGGNSWTDVGQVKVSVGYDRANHRYVDVNGDGRADFLWINKFTGEVQVWLNEGQFPAIGSSFTWSDQGFRYAGHAQGHCMHYPNIGGLGLADMHYAHSTVNNAETWFNTCGGTASLSTNGDDGTIADPGLEVYTLASTYDPSTGVFEETGSSGASCIGGTGPDDPVGLKALCSTTCMYNDCPSPCLCTTFGTLVIPPTGDGSSGTGSSGQSAVIDSLCALACPQGVCPTTLCVAGTGNSGSTTGSGGGGYGSYGSNNDTNGWRDISCDYGSLTSVDNDPIQQWADAAASGAFSDVWTQFKADSKGMTFSNYVADFFHAHPTIDCEDVTSANCDVTINCGEADFPNAAVNSPAGYMIINSMVYFHIELNNMYEGMLAAYTFMLGDIGSFASQFAPQLDELESDISKVLIDLIGFTYSIFSAGLFNSWLKNIPYFKANSNLLGTTKDLSNTIVSQSITLVKDSQAAVEDLRTQNTLTSLLEKTVQYWMYNIGNLSDSFFNDPSTVYNSIVNGMFWDPEISLSALDLTKSVQLSLYAYMTPVAWSLSATDAAPFIATSEGLGHSGSDVCSGYNANTLKRDYDIYFESGILGSASAMYCDGTNAYWLVSMKKSTQPHDNICGSSAAAPGVCTSGIGPHVESLPGLDKLDGTVYGGLTAAALFESALKAYKDNGNKNGWAASDTSTEEGLADIYDNGINAHGMVNIPVCSFLEAYGNAWPDVTSDNYPCP